MSAVRRTLRVAVDRLPVGREAALRAGRIVSATLDGRWKRPRVGAPLPARFRVYPPAPVIDRPWPEPPLIEQPMGLVREDVGADAAPPPVFDVELFEALNAEYESKPLVPAPRGNDAESATARARKRLQTVHSSINLADKRVLEFGCAAGYEVWTVARHFGSDAVGVDVQERRAWQALRGERVEFVEADIASDRPFAENSFDRIISFSVFEHVTHPQASAAELYRILRPGGLAWISANLYRGPMASHRYREVFFPWPHILFEDDVFREFYRRRGLPSQGPAWVNRLSWQDYEAMFRRIGFRFLSLHFAERPIDEAFYRRFEGILGRYPRWDLQRDFFNVVLQKPR